MRRALALLLLSGGVAVGGAPDSSAALAPEGRWEGSVQIPERALTLVVDLARDASGAWRGSLIVPHLGLSGAPLSGLVVTETEIVFEIGGPFATAQGPASVKLRAAGEPLLAGELRQAGNVAAVTLRRIGVAHVEAPPRSTTIAADLAGGWQGRYELGGYPRTVTIVLRNRGDGATGDWTIVGKQTTTLPVDRVAQDGAYVRVEASTFRAAFEGRYHKQRGALEGTVELGGMEIPLVLHRAPQPSR